LVSTALDRARGVLWGQAIGDALGTTHEFVRADNAKSFPHLNAGPLTDIVGGGPFHVEPGQVTDDTHMAICLASSLADRGGFDPDDVARRYVEWADVAFDIGNLTRAVLAKIRQGTSSLEAGFEVWEHGGRDGAPNGSLMRTSAIPVFFRNRPDELRRAALNDSLITHADPRCRLACASFGAAVRHAITDPTATPKSIHSTAIAELRQAMPFIEPRTPAALIGTAFDALNEDLELADRADPGLDVYRHAGFVRVAFRLAFWELLHAPTFEAGVLDCANRGGDADTNAAIAGALLGGRFGESAIPSRWRTRVENACRSPGWSKSPMYDRYHPRRLFDVIPSAG
jgi:ADP-ribosylglycohydrolase